MLTAVICVQLVDVGEFIEVYCIMRFGTQIFPGTGIPTVAVCVQLVDVGEFIEVYCIM